MESTTMTFLEGNNVPERSNNVTDAVVVSNHFLVGLKDFSLKDMPDTDKIAKNLREDRERLLWS